jgi:hypothetical protein
MLDFCCTVILPDRSEFHLVTRGRFVDLVAKKFPIDCQISIYYQFLLIMYHQIQTNG